MYSRPSPLRFGMPISYGIAVKCFVRRSAHAFPWHRWRRRPMKAPLRGGSQLARFYPRRHLRSGLVSPIQGAPNFAGTSLYRRLSLPRLKQLKRQKQSVVFYLLVLTLTFSGTLFFSRREGCRRKNGGARTNLLGANLNNACVSPVGVRRRDAPNTRDCRSFR